MVEVIVIGVHIAKTPREKEWRMMMMMNEISYKIYGLFYILNSFDIANRNSLTEDRCFSLLIIDLTKTNSCCSCTVVVIKFSHVI